MILSLGVVDYPYADTGQTTGEVAEILEDKYGVMQKFADQNLDFMAQSITDGVIGAIENAFAGAPQTANVFAEGLSKIEDRFHDYIDHEEHGIRTKSKEKPLSGVRKKRQYRRVTGKTTFVDSGLYRNSFKVWVKESLYG